MGCEKDADCRRHLSARWDPPGTINEGLEDLDWTSWGQGLHTPDHRFAGAADISNALRAQSRHCAKPAALKLDSTWGRKLRQIL